MKYIQEYLIHYYEIDQNKRLKPSVLISYLQDIAILNSTEAGLSLDDYEKMNRGFMLLNWCIKVYLMPEFKQTIKIITEPTTFKRFLANRKYWVKDKKGNLLAEANSVWIFADTQTRKPCQIPDDIYLKFGIDKESYKYFDKLNTIQAVHEGEIYDKIKITNNDIDTNNHVNNVCYVVWALDPLPLEWINKYLIKEINVNYKRELYFGDDVKLITKFDENKEYKKTAHSFYNNDVEICNVEFCWI
ncbi:MAG: acyl-ACP thioesterase domain-containing protein [bacterium]